MDKKIYCNIEVSLMLLEFFVCLWRVTVATIDIKCSLSAALCARDYVRCSGISYERKLTVPGFNDITAFNGGPVVIESPCQCKRCKRRLWDPWAGKIPWSRKWQPTPEFLSGKYHWQRSLAGYSPCMELQRVRQNWAGTPTDLNMQSTLIRWSQI